MQYTKIPLSMNTFRTVREAGVAKQEPHIPTGWPEVFREAIGSARSIRVEVFGNNTKVLPGERLQRVRGIFWLAEAEKRSVQM